MPENIRMVDDMTDLVYSSEDRLWYFQEYRMDGSGDSRVSTTYTTEKLAREAWEDRSLNWRPWD